MQLVAVPHVLRTESQCQQMHQHVESHLSILHVFTASASACS